MTAKTKMAFSLVALALAASACGSSASAAGVNADLTQSVASTYCTAPPLPNTAPPQEGSISDPNGGPTATACWADGLYVGNGSLTDKQIIFAAKQVDFASQEISPQAVRKDSTQVEHDLIGSISKYTTQSAVSTILSALKNAAKTGNSAVLTGKNPVDPTGIVDADYQVTHIGARVTSSSGHVTDASVLACVNSQIYNVNASGAKVAGVAGETGDFAWTDTMQQTASGWIMTGWSTTKAVSSCPN